MGALTFSLISLLLLTAVAAAEKRIVCYYSNWSVYWKENGKFDIADIDPSLCTHLVHSFIILNGNRVVSSDKWADLSDGGGKDGFRFFRELRRKNPNIKLLVALGGWNDSQGSKYSIMASTRESRQEFVQSVLEFIRTHKFDGFDFDWEYPTQNGGAPADRVNFVELLKELRKHFDREGLLLTMAAAASQWTADQAYDIPNIVQYVDFINLMTFDFHGKWEQVTGHHAAFRGQLSVESSVEYWLKKGCPKDKLVVGIPTYGRGWTLSNSRNNGVGAAASGPAIAGPYTKEASMLSYNEICEMFSAGDWTLKFDEEAQAPFAVKDNQWISYDNVKSVTIKSKFINNLGLGGAMLWSLPTDDFHGFCGEKWPILRTLNAILRNGKPVQGERIPSAPIQRNVPVKSAEINPIWRRPNQVESTSSECVRPGNMPDPNSCNYFSCVAKPLHGYTRYRMFCPAALCYNRITGLCDWPQ